MRSTPKKKLLWILGALVGVAAVGLALLIFTRHRTEKDQRDRLEQAAQLGPRVYVAQVEKADGARTVTLPGDVRAYNQAAIYAKTQGYVREVKVDKGDRVKAGQVLAIIESPETDQQVAVARSDLAVKRRTAVRTRALAESGIVSQQDVDLAEADLEQAGANLKRLRSLQEYQVLRAPFDGVVTARNLDPGALIPDSSTGTPLVEVADPDTLRVIVYAGQDVASFLTPGTEAEIVQDEHPDRVIRTQVTRLSDAFDPRTRTMLAEIQLDNRERTLVPGVFVHVTLHVKAPAQASVPIEAILVRGAKTMVALVQDKQVKLTPVVPGLNDGKTVRLKTPLDEGALVALDLPVELGDGARIQPERRQKRDDTAQAQGGSGDAGKGEPPDKQLGRQQAQRAESEKGGEADTRKK
ncbi:efflux RND transporter periplasmic adaptor subunit [Archangium primigenium]|uniref:efflux RND transporter periplasmic adaptor subunit n=1 Tax=[Archangium] primigenium TaxID=2792470 RepID=UPI001958402D|nr:efflux RND transporter periplasmic adaptor subunit [Archangium primigenium]MBM7114607.1 efflux RND transporter periplasmic adaptor subunit [Archangium primigenium]